MAVESASHHSSILTPQLQTALESQALKEGLLDREDYAFAQLYEHPQGYGRGGVDHRLLIHICLFPSIETTRSDFVLDQVVARSGLPIRQIEPRSIRRNIMCDLNGEIEHSNFDKIIESCHEEILRICVAQEAHIIRLIEGWIAPDSSSDLAHLKKSEALAIRRICRRSFIPTVEVLTGWYGGDMSATPFQGLGVELQLADGTNLPGWILQDPYFEAWLDKVDDFYVRLLATMFYARLDSSSAGVGQWWRKSGSISRQQEVRALEIAHLCTIQFRSELRVVPDPRNIAEAVELGNSKEMERLRQKIWEWVDDNGISNEAVDVRVRRDIEKASKEIKRLKRFKELNESPLVFGTKLALGQIPIISNVVTAVDAAGWAYERLLSRRNLWVAIK